MRRDRSGDIVVAVPLQKLAPVLALTILPACVRPADPVPIVVGSAAPPKAAPTASSAAGSARKSSLSAVAAEIDRKCAAQPTEETTLGVKAAAGKRIECKRAARDAVLAPIEEALREPWTQLAEIACWMSEEARWIDFDAGTRDDGTLRGLVWQACSEATAVEVAVLAQAYRDQDGAGLAVGVRARKAEGQKAKAAVLELYRKVRQLQVKSLPLPSNNGGTPLNQGEVLEYSTKLNRLVTTPGLLGARTCAKMPSLAAALGGEKACGEQVALYYFAFGEYSDAP